jgi:predicted NBD/HSP70 family sugar kinase
MDLRANILQEEKRTVASTIRPEEAAQEISDALKNCMAQKGLSEKKLLGTGVGVAGLVDPEQGIIHHSPGFPRCRDVHFADLVSETLHIPAYLENEVAMSTLAEMWFGKGRSCSNFLFLHLGPGIRMGIVIHGSLYHGATGNAGELGHITYDPEGPFCHCGNAGCLELYVSSEALLSYARDTLTSHTTSLLVELCDSDPNRLEIPMLLKAAQEKDRLALNLLLRFCRPIGQTMANVVNLFDTEKIILGGNYSQARDIILENLKQEIERRSLPILSRNLSIELSDFDQTSTAIGGGALVLQKICDGEGVAEHTESSVE